jgi:hypothetical protein
MVNNQYLHQIRHAAVIVVGGPLCGRFDRRINPNGHHSRLCFGLPASHVNLPF